MWKWFNPTSPRLRWTRWVLLGIAIIIIGIGLALNYYYFHYMRMDEDLLLKADAAFGAGFTVQDRQNDIVPTMGEKDKDSKERPNNPEAYIASFFDLKSISVGIDDEYIYYKYSLWGQIPKKAPSFNGDTIKDVGIKFNVMDANAKDRVILFTNFGWVPVFGIAATNTYYLNQPTGIEMPEEARFARQDSDSKISGGSGTDYVIGAFPLERLGIKKGDKLYVNLSLEASSSKYDHASVDFWGGASKEAAYFVEWQAGTNKYSIKSTPSKQSDNSNGRKIDEGVVDFETCAKKYPVLETYPEQCKTPDGRSFTKEY